MKQGTTLSSVRADPTALIADSAKIGKPFRPLLEGEYRTTSDTVVCEHVWIGEYCLVGAGSTIGARTILDDFSVVGCNVSIGERCLIYLRAQISSEAVVDEDCIIGGLVCERSRVGEASRVFGSLVHAQRTPQLPWDADDSREPAPTVGDHVVIGRGAVVIGDVTIGAGSYVGANAIVTRDVPSRHVCVGNNKVIPFSKYAGRLADSQLFHHLAAGAR